MDSGFKLMLILSSISIFLLCIGFWKKHKLCMLLSTLNSIAVVIGGATDVFADFSIDPSPVNIFRILVIYALPSFFAGFLWWGMLLNDKKGGTWKPKLLMLISAIIFILWIITPPQNPEIRERKKQEEIQFEKDAKEFYDFYDAYEDAKSNY